MRKLHVIFRWDHYVTQRDAFQTSRWFAAWAKQNGDYIASRATNVFLEVSMNDRPEYRAFADAIQERRAQQGPLPTVTPPAMQPLFARGIDPESLIGPE